MDGWNASCRLHARRAAQMLAEPGCLAARHHALNSCCLCFFSPSQFTHRGTARHMWWLWCMPARNVLAESLCRRPNWFCPPTDACVTGASAIGAAPRLGWEAAAAAAAATAVVLLALPAFHRLLHLPPLQCLACLPSTSTRATSSCCRLGLLLRTSA